MAQNICIGRAVMIFTLINSVSGVPLLGCSAIYNSPISFMRIYTIIDSIFIPLSHSMQSCDWKQCLGLYIGTVKCVHPHTCAFAPFSSFKFCACLLPSRLAVAIHTWPRVLRCKIWSKRSWAGRNVIKHNIFPQSMVMTARPATLAWGLRNCCCAVRKLWVPNRVKCNYRHLKWLWSTQCRVYLFLDARQQLHATAAWLINFLNSQS